MTEFVSARLVGLASQAAYAIILDERFRTVLSLPFARLVTLGAATAPVKKLAHPLRCPIPIRGCG